MNRACIRGDAEETPLPLHELEEEIEINPLRLRREKAGHPQHAARIEFGLAEQLGLKEQDWGQIEIAAAQIGESLGEFRRTVRRLETWRAHVAKHAIIACCVGLIKCNQRRQDQHHEFVIVWHAGSTHCRRLRRLRLGPGLALGNLRSLLKLCIRLRGLGAHDVSQQRRGNDESGNDWNGTQAKLP